MATTTPQTTGVPWERGKRGRPAGPDITSDAVRAVRDKLGLTQQQLATRLECGMSTVQKLERTRSLPVVAKLSERFNELAREAEIDIADFEVKET